MLNQSGLRDVISLDFCLVSDFEVQIVESILGLHCSWAHWPVTVIQSR